MIVYKNILEKLKDAGYNTYVLMKQGLISQGTLTNIRQGKSISISTLNVICGLLNCQPGEILEFVPDQSENSEKEPASQ